MERKTTSWRGKQSKIPDNKKATSRWFFGSRISWCLPSVGCRQIWNHPFPRGAGKSRFAENLSTDVAALRGDVGNCGFHVQRPTFPHLVQIEHCAVPFSYLLSREGRVAPRCPAALSLVLSTTDMWKKISQICEKFTNFSSKMCFLSLMGLASILLGWFFSFLSLGCLA